MPVVSKLYPPNFLQLWLFPKKHPWRYSHACQLVTKLHDEMSKEATCFFLKITLHSVGGPYWFRIESVRVTVLHAHDCIHGARFQHVDGYLGDNARPLGSVNRGFVHSIQHILVDSKPQIVCIVQVPELPTNRREPGAKICLR